MFVITGGSGFIGSALVWKLNQLGIDEILIVDQSLTPTCADNLHPLRYADYLDSHTFLRLVETNKLSAQVKGVFHLGACSSTMETSKHYLYQNNFLYSKRLAQWCLERRVRYVYASSAATYGNGRFGYCDRDAITPKLTPMNLYGWSKQWMDLWALKTGAAKQTVGVKFFNVFGPNEYHKEVMRSVVCKAFHQIQETGQLKLFKSYHPYFAHGEQRRDFVYVKDCVDVLWWFYENPHVGGIFNLGTGQSRTWNDLAHAVFAALGLPANIEYIEMPAHLQKQYQYYTQAEMTKLRSAGCQHEFHSLESAIHDYVVNYLNAPLPHLNLHPRTHEQDQTRTPPRTNRSPRPQAA